jgi:predicted PurR-regulated permease PerM
MRPVFQPSPEDWPYLRRLGWTILAAAAIVIFWRATNLLLLAFGSVLGAIVIRSVAGRLQRVGIRNQTVALVLGILVVLSVLALVAWLLGVQFGEQLAGIAADLPGTIDAIERALSTTAVGNAIVQAVHSAAGGGTIANRLGEVMLGGGEVLLNFAIVLVGAMFIAADPRPYVSALILLTPPPGRPAMKHAFRQVSAALRLWLKAKLIEMTVMAVLISAALWFAGVPSWAALGLLAGLAEFVPYVGPAVAMVPAIGLAATAGSDVLLRALAGYVVVRVIEAYVLTPWLNREVVKIPPALTLFVILGVGAVFGIYGVFFAGALLVVAFVAVRELYLRDTLGEDLEGLPPGTRD